MFGAFNLRDGYDQGSFRRSFNAFCDHLEKMGFLRSHRLWRRAYHDGYDTRFPNAGIVLEMCFHNQKASLDAWDYVENHAETVRILHMAMNKQVKETHFVLLQEDKSDEVQKRQE